VRLTRLIIVSASLLLAAAATAAAQAQARPDALTERIRAELPTLGVPGVVWAIVSGDSTTTGAAGIRDLATGKRITPDARVQLGSVTKTLLATGVLQLATRGLVDLDAPLARYLSDLPIDNPWESTDPIRVRHLLDHSSGLGDAHLWQVFSANTSPDLPLRNAIARKGQTIRLQARPGQRFSYSNTGFLLLGVLIEARTGERYEQWLDRELLAPLGMSQSSFAWTTQVGPQADTTMAMGHFEGGTPQPSYAIPVRPASQFATTARDMARFARFLMNDGRVNGSVLVDSALLAAMGRPRDTDAVRAGLPNGYALGLQSRERWGVVTHCHTGNIGTFRAILCLAPAAQRAFFASYNSDPESAPWDRVDSLLAAELQLPRLPAPSPARIAQESAQRWSGWYTQRPTRFEQFAYLDAVGSLTRVEVSDTLIRLSPTGGARRVLAPSGGRLWRVVERRGVTHALLEGEGGALSITDGTRTLDRVPVLSVYVRWASAVLGLVALLLILLRGLWVSVQAWRAGALRREPLWWTTLSVVAMLVAAAGLAGQGFLAIGDRTASSVGLAVGSVGLVVAVGLSVVHLGLAVWRGGVVWVGRRGQVFDLLVALGLAQWVVVLVWWELDLDLDLTRFRGARVVGISSGC